MPLTFARGLDPMLQVPAVQQRLVGALLTLPFVDPADDATRGAAWRAMRHWGWITCREEARDVIFVRRCAGAGGAVLPSGSLWIGIRLNGRDYRITCAALEVAAAARLRRRLDFVGLGLLEPEALPDAGAFRALSIRPMDAAPADVWPAVAMATCRDPH